VEIFECKSKHFPHFLYRDVSWHAAVYYNGFIPIANRKNPCSVANYVHCVAMLRCCSTLVCLVLLTSDLWYFHRKFLVFSKIFQTFGQWVGLLFNRFLFRLVTLTEFHLCLGTGKSYGICHVSPIGTGYVGGKYKST